MAAGGFAVDPVPAAAISVAMGVVLAVGALQKLRDPALFRETLAGYRVLPRPLTWPAALAVIAAEASAAVLLLAAPGRPAGPWAALALLALVTAAAGLAVAQGRAGIDCGCGGVGAQPPVSRGLVLRNLACGVLLLLALQAGPARPMNWVDALTLAAGALLLIGLYVAANQLLANHYRLRGPGSR
jgi:hypothetical protein